MTIPNLFTTGGRLYWRTPAGALREITTIDAVEAETPYVAPSDVAVLLWSDDFNGSAVNWNKWAPVASWQDQTLGTLDLGGATSWLANPDELFGGVGANVLDEVPTAANWHTWFGTAPTFDTGVMHLAATAERLAPARIIAGSVYTLTVASAAGAIIQPYIRAHNNGASYLTPAEAVSADANGPLQSKASAAAQTWTITFSGDRSDIDLRLVTNVPVDVTHVTLDAPGDVGQALDPFVVAGSTLTINAARTPDWAVPGIAVDLGVDEADVPLYVGGQLISQGLSFTEGYIEVRARFDAYQGMFPAIWLYALVTEPYDHRKGEIDFPEVFGNEDATPANFTLHFNNGDAGAGTPQRTAVTWTESIDASDWHIYGLERTSTTLKFYIDGTLMHTVTGADATWFAGLAMEIRLTHAIGADWFSGGNLPTW